MNTLFLFIAPPGVTTSSLLSALKNSQAPVCIELGYRLAEIEAYVRLHSVMVFTTARELERPEVKEMLARLRYKTEIMLLRISISTELFSAE